MFSHLSSHSYFSLLEGLPSPSELVQAAVRLEMPALAITDHHLLTGAIDFYDACRESGVKPLLGLTLDVALPTGLPALNLGGRPGQLILLAEDSQGWENLCRLSSYFNTEPEIHHGLLFDHLSQNHKGLICITDGLRSWPAGYLLKGKVEAAEATLRLLAELFSDRLYAGVQLQSSRDTAWVRPLIDLCRWTGIKAVPYHSIYYIKPEDANLQRVTTSIRLNLSLEELPEGASAPPDAYFISPADVAARFSTHLPQVRFSKLSDSIQEIVDRCHLELPLGAPHFPAYDLPQDSNVDQALRGKAVAGARKLYGDTNDELPPDIQARLNFELGIIAQCGYASLFLVMEEIVQFARSKGIPISSRGSAGSSLVAHCLGITSPDPIRLNLYFERFLNPARRTPPDIDTDICSRRRDEVIQFVYDRFGKDRVAMVCTINRFRARSALREVAKAYDLPPGQIKILVDNLPYRWWNPADHQGSARSPYEDLAERYNTPIHRSLFRDANALLGVPNHLSIHPGGIVISPGPIYSFAPTQLAPKGVVITQFDLGAIERLGLVKIDLLGIRGLTVLGDVAEKLLNMAGSSEQGSLPQGMISDVTHLDRPSGLDVLAAVPDEDQTTSNAICEGRTIGCFQIESPGMRATLKQIKARSLDDLMIALALYRPGPLTGGLKDAFVRRHRGLEKTSHLHSSLAPLLDDTYGVILYQEQVLRIAHDLGGLSLADSDLLRRAMSHFNPGKQMETLKRKFISGAMDHSQAPRDVAEQVWELMAAFAGYGFPKAHAASYAQVAWRSVWCKVHFPAIFLGSVMANWGGYYSQRIYLTEARRQSLPVKPPHINYSGHEFSVIHLDQGTVLFMGLDQVRELTSRTLGRILKERPFCSLEDFMTRADPRPVEVRNLIRVGAFEGMGVIPSLLKRLGNEKWIEGQLSLFSYGLDEEQMEEDWSLKEKVFAQEEILGAAVSAHPLDLVADEVAKAHALNTVEVAARTGERVRIAGMRQTWRRFAAAHSGYIYFMSLEDLEGMVDTIISGDVYRRNKAAFSEPGPYIIE
ncbi:MAG: DNA polymerase III subunit alpha, partial [Omnitrophica WOR_2 bacterium]